MNEIELSELIHNTNMYEIACKTARAIPMNMDEKKVSAQLDTHFKQIGKTGVDANHEIASFVQKVVNEELYDAPDELLDLLFDRGTIGEFDDYQGITTPKNTLIAHEAAKGGNVARSFLDANVLTTQWKNRQIETDISYADLARNGWKSVALVTEYATSAFKNAMFRDIFDTLDAAIQSGAENYLVEATASPTQATMDWMALYIADRASSNRDGVIVALSKYIQAASKLKGFTSDDIINEVHRTGRLGTYDGISMTPISGAKKLGSGELLMIDKRMFGIAGKIGQLNMRGDIKVYQDADNNKEVYHLMLKDFTYGWSFNKNTLEMVCKTAITG